MKNLVLSAIFLAVVAPISQAVGPLDSADSSNVPTLSLSEAEIRADDTPSDFSGSEFSLAGLSPLSAVTDELKEKIERKAKFDFAKRIGEGITKDSPDIKVQFSFEAAGSYYVTLLFRESAEVIGDYVFTETNGNYVMTRLNLTNYQDLPNIHFSILEFFHDTAALLEKITKTSTWVNEEGFLTLRFTATQYFEAGIRTFTEYFKEFFNLNTLKHDDLDKSVSAKVFYTNGKISSRQFTDLEYENDGDLGRKIERVEDYLAEKLSQVTNQFWVYETTTSEPEDLKERVELINTFNPAGQITMRHEKGSVYQKNKGHLGDYDIVATFENGVLNSFAGAIVLDDTTKIFLVIYEILDGKVDATKVFEPGGNEIRRLGGRKFIHPRRIIKKAALPETA